jgi:hypothetical protein
MRRYRAWRWPASEVNDLTSQMRLAPPAPCDASQARGPGAPLRRDLEVDAEGITVPREAVSKAYSPYQAMAILLTSIPETGSLQGS